MNSRRPRSLALLLFVLTTAARGGGEGSGEPGVAEGMGTIEITRDEANLTISEPGGCGPHAFECEAASPAKT